MNTLDDLLAAKRKHRNILLAKHKEELKTVDDDIEVLIRAIEIQNASGVVSSGSETAKKLSKTEQRMAQRNEGILAYLRAHPGEGYYKDIAISLGENPVSFLDWMKDSLKKKANELLWTSGKTKTYLKLKG